MAGEVDELAVEARVVAQVVAGELDVEVFVAELLDEFLGEGFGVGLFSMEEETGELVVAVAGEGGDRSAVEVPSRKWKVKSGGVRRFATGFGGIMTGTVMPLVGGSAPEVVGEVLAELGVALAGGG